MTQPRRPSLTRQRLARLETWAGLWLLRLAACLAHIAPSLAPPIQPTVRLLLNLLILRVAELTPPPILRRSHRPQRALRANLRRAILGDLRKHLRARTLGERLTKLLELVRDMDLHALRIATRLANGLTRLRPILARGADEACADMAAPPRVCADTS
jgi:hypothetical protein